MLVAILAAALVAPASARGRDFVFSAVPQTQFVAPGENAAFNWSATNNTSAPAACDVYVQELGLTVFNGVIQPGTSAGGQVSTPALYKNSRFTFNLSCDGSFIKSDSSNVKVR